MVENVENVTVNNYGAGNDGLPVDDSAGVQDASFDDSSFDNSSDFGGDSGFDGGSTDV